MSRKVGFYGGGDWGQVSHLANLAKLFQILILVTGSKIKPISVKIKSITFRYWKGSLCFVRICLLAVVKILSKNCACC